VRGYVHACVHACVRAWQYKYEGTGHDKLSHSVRARTNEDDRDGSDKRRLLKKHTFPRNPSSISMQPRRPDEMQSFQKDVYPSRSCAVRCRVRCGAVAGSQT
jgi:hypothetical protein